MRELRLDQEPAKHQWVVVDDDDGRVVFGPTPDKLMAETFIDGYDLALEYLDDGRLP